MMRIHFLILTLLSSMPVFADYRSDYPGSPTDEWKQMVVDATFGNVDDSIQSRQNLLWLESIIANEVARDPESPFNWYLLGVIKSSAYSHRLLEIKAEIRRRQFPRQFKDVSHPSITEETAATLAAYRVAANHDVTLGQLNKMAIDAYHGALERDDRSRASQRLNTKALSNISMWILLDAKTRIRAIRKTLDHPHALDEEIGPDYAYNAYQLMLGIYLGDKDDDGALRLLNEMSDRFPARASEIERTRVEIVARRERNQNSSQVKSEASASSLKSVPINQRR